jgi:hypothetical protein
MHWITLQKYWNIQCLTWTWNFVSVVFHFPCNVNMSARPFYTNFQILLKMKV